MKTLVLCFGAPLIQCSARLCLLSLLTNCLKSFCFQHKSVCASFTLMFPLYLSPLGMRGCQSNRLKQLLRLVHLAHSSLLLTPLCRRPLILMAALHYYDHSSRRGGPVSGIKYIDWVVPTSIVLCEVTCLCWRNSGAYPYSFFTAPLSCSSSVTFYCSLLVYACHNGRPPLV